MNAYLSLPLTFFYIIYLRIEKRSSQKQIEHEYLVGKGYVLNIIHDRYSAQTLHIVLTSGSMKIGDYFVAGGWSGRVKLFIVTKSEDKRENSRINQQDDGMTKVDVIEKGMAVKLSVVLHEERSNPRPLGHDIYFFSGRTHPQYDTSKGMKNLQEQVKEETEYFMDQAIMQESFELHKLSDEDRKLLRIDQTLSNQKGLSPFYKHILSMSSDRDHEDEEEEGREDSDSGKIVVLLFMMMTHSISCSQQPASIWRSRAHQGQQWYYLVKSIL